MAWTGLGEPLLLDPVLWELYCRGFTENEAATYLVNSATTYSAGIPLSARVDSERVALDAADNLMMTHLVLRDVVDQMRSLATLEAAMGDPRALLDGAFPLVTLSDREILESIQMYYTYEPAVIRSFLGKQLTTKMRKDLDDVVDSTGVRIKACWKDFDNLRRIFNYFDDWEFSVPIFTTTMHRFCLEPALAWNYTCLLFLLKHRFTIADTRRSLAHVPVDVFVSIASAMLCCWCNVSDAPPSAPWRDLIDVLEYQVTSGAASDFPIALPVIQEGSAGTDDHAAMTVSSSVALSTRGTSSVTSPKLPLGWTAPATAAPLLRSNSAPEETSVRINSGVPLPSSDVSRSITAMSGLTTHSSLSHMTPAQFRRQSSQNTMTETHTIGLSPDNAMLLSIRDLSARLSRSKTERLEHLTAVSAHFASARHNGKESNTAVCVRWDAIAQRPREVEEGDVAVAAAVGTPGAPDTEKLRKIEALLPAVLKYLRELASSLSSASALRDVFEDVREKIVQPLQDAGISNHDAALLCTCIGYATPSLQSIAAVSAAHRDAFTSQWKRFMAVIEVMVVLLYDM